MTTRIALVVLALAAGGHVTAAAAQTGPAGDTYGGEGGQLTPLAPPAADDPSQPAPTIGAGTDPDDASDPAATPPARDEGRAPVATSDSATGAVAGVSASSGDDLADTGLDVSLLALAGSVLLVIGVLARRVLHRRSVQ